MYGEVDPECSTQQQQQQQEEFQQQQTHVPGEDLNEIKIKLKSTINKSTTAEVQQRQ